MTHATHVIQDFLLTSGAVLPHVTVAYRRLGEINAARDNVVLVLHGYTTGPAMLDPGANVAEGSWSELVGPGKPIDTHRYCVICPNMLGSCYGSTGPDFKPDFPPITVLDIVNTQKALLDALGIRRLAAVAGPSFGAYQSFQWAASYPDMVDRVVAAVGAPWHPAPRSADGILRALHDDAGWDAYRRGERGAMIPFLTAQRVRTLTLYGVDAELAERFPDHAERAAEVTRLAREWAEQFDPMSLVVLMRAAESFDVRPDLVKLRAPVLFVLSRSDPVFSPELGQAVMRMPGTEHWTYIELDSDKGHFASGADAALWAEALRRFMPPPQSGDTV
jgi:homoserine O-acetyltransferase